MLHIYEAFFVTKEVEAKDVCSDRDVWFSILLAPQPLSRGPVGAPSVKI